MAVDLKTLSPKELQSLIANAEAQMQEAKVTQIQEVRRKIDNLLSNTGLALADVYPTRGGKAGKAGKAGKRSAVAPKYRNPEDPTQTWTGRGKRPLWFAAAIKKRGVTAENLLIAGTNSEKTKAAPVKKSPRKATRKKVRGR